MTNSNPFGKTTNTTSHGISELRAAPSLYASGSFSSKTLPENAKEVRPTHMSPELPDWEL
jgi:hypothetical protein